MIQIMITRPNVKKQLTYSILSILLIITILPTFHHLVLSTSFIDEDSKQISFQLNDSDPVEEPMINRKINGFTQDSDEEIIFPTFLYSSIEIANLLIENLWDNNSEGFFFSTNEQWENASINTEKRTFDNARAILALTKLADAVINQSERDFALNIAERTVNGMENNLWDPDFDGFFVSSSDRYKKPGIHGIAIQAFLALHKATNNSVYLNKAIETLSYIDNIAWNTTHEYYIYVTSHTGAPLLQNPYSGDPYDPQSLRVDHNVIMGNALLDLYEVGGNETYLTKARKIYDVINATCRNTSTNLFYTGVDTDFDVVVPEATDLFINSVVLEFVAHLYNATEDTKYYDEYFYILNSVLLNFWDNENGGFIATSSALPLYADPTKYTERQFYGIRALDAAYRLSDNHLYYNLILDVIEILNNNLYDNLYGGYYQLADVDGTQSGDPSWKRKVTVTQSLAIYSLANIWLYSKPSALNVIWSPNTPRPQDKVTLIIAAFDPVGISTVFLNYSIDNGDYELQEMLPHSVGNMFNTSLDPPHPDGTTIDFNIIINNTNNEQVIRGNYAFLWQNDRWPPVVQEIGFLPGIEIPVDEEFSILVSAQDVPSQGLVKYIRLHYYRTGLEEISLPLTKIDVHLWEIKFPDGIPTPATYAYYFESIDFNLNPGFSEVNYFYILGHLDDGLPMSLVLSLLIGFGIVIPAGLYSYVELKKKSARKQLKLKKEVRFRKRGRKLGKRGTRRT